MDTAKSIDKIDKTKGKALIAILMTFLTRCVQPNNYFTEIQDKMKSGRLEELPTIGNAALGHAFHRLAIDRDLGAIATIIDIVSRVDHRERALSAGNC